MKKSRNSNAREVPRKVLAIEVHRKKLKKRNKDDNGDDPTGNTPLGNKS